MLRNVYRTTLRSRRRGIIGWSIGLLALAAYTSALFPIIQESAADLSALVDRLPEGLRALTNSTFDFTTGEGFLTSQPFGFLVPLLLLIFLIGFGSRTVAGEEEDGTLELVLATPLTRRSIVAQKLAAMLTGLAWLGFVVWAAYSVGDALAGMEVGAAALALLVLNAVLLAMVFGTLALAVGCLWGRRSLAVAVAAALATATYLLNAFAELAEAVEPFTVLSPWRAYDPSGVLRGGLEAGDVLVLVGLGVVFSVIALLAFDRRDVAA